MGIFSFFNRKASAPAASGRLPLPTAGGSGRGGFRWTGNGFQFVEYLLVGGKQPPIQPKDAGILRLNPIVACCLQWIGTSWPLAIPQVGTWKGKEFVPDPKRHPVLDLLQRPNPDTSGKWLFSALNGDFWEWGNAYAHIVSAGLPQELNYVPAWCIKPVPDEYGYLKEYEHTVDGKKRTIPKEEIVHFKFGIDPDNPLLGVSPLASAFREIVKDNSAADYLAGLFKRGGMPPGILSPKPGKDAQGELVMDHKEAEAITKAMQEKMEAEPGSLRFLGVGLDYNALAWEPGKMGIETILEEPETRIPALFQIPPEVLKLRAGLLRGTYNNVKEARRAAWEGNLIPTQDYFAEELTNRLLSRYPNSAGKVIRYDRSNVPELQDDVNEKREQARKDHDAGLITVEEARAEGGRETTPQILAQLEAERPQPPALPEPADPQPQPGQKSRGRKDREQAKPDLFAALDAFRAELDRSEEKAVSSMEDALQVVEAAIRERLEELIIRMEQAVAASEPISESWLLQETRYRALLDQTESALADLAEQQAGPLKDAQHGAVTAAAEHAELLTRAALGEVPEGVSVAFNRLPLSTLETFTGFASDGSPLRSLLDELGPEASRNVRDGLLRGIAEGKSPRQIARYVEDATGLTRNRALTIARTEVNRAARAAAVQSYQANSDVVSGWIWLSALTTRTCAGCWAMHGTFHTNDEVLDDHPNGRCVASPRTRSLAEIVGDPSIPDTRPVIETGAAQFARLSSAEQEEILGKQAYQLYRDGKIQLSHMVVQTSDPRWGTMRRPATLAEAQAAAGVK